MDDTCRACGLAVPPGAAACPHCGTTQTGTVPSITSRHRPTIPTHDDRPLRPQTEEFAPSEPTVMRPPSRPTGPGVGYPPASLTPPASFSGAAASGTKNRRGLVIGLVAAGVVVIAALATTVIVLATHHSPDRTVLTAPDQSGSDDAATAVPEVTPAPSETTIEDTVPATEATTPTTEAPSPGTAVLFPGVTDDQHSVDIVQQLATALATGDWNAARSTWPKISDWSDDRFTQNYGDLDQSTVVATSVSADGGHVSGAYVAWQNASSGQQTSIFCEDWLVDPSSGTVIDQPGGNDSAIPFRSGWVSPSDRSVTDWVAQHC